MDLQSQMMTKLGTNRRQILHPTSKGDATEQNWREMLRSYLPQRYGVEKAFVIDCRGKGREATGALARLREMLP